MQWAPRAGAGFTTGKPWEAPQPDSLKTTVEAEDADPGSLLNLYRRLIHLRQANEALATGRLVPIPASSPQVAAYLRVAGDHVVLVVANLGAAAVSGVSVSSGDRVLPPGTYTPRNLLGGPNGIALPVGSDGRLAGYVPIRAAIGPRESLVLDLVRR
jgi:glycosidase